MRAGTRILVTTVLIALTSASLSAQVTETPVAFDSAGRVRSLTPALVVRLELVPPAWPVTGAFREARLYAVSTGGRVLVVERVGGDIDRYALSDDAVHALQMAVDAAMSARGALVTETQTDVVSEPARGAFVRNQMLLAAGLYGPALAAQTNNGRSAGAIYLLAVGSSYFAVTSIANRTTVTRVQNDLATDGALRGAMFANGLYSVVGPEEPYGKVSALVTLGGALGGSVVGFRRARGLTDAEGKGAKSASSYSSLTMAGLIGIAGITDSNQYRATTAATIGAGIAGYILGPRYPRRNAYTVTAGDINMLWVGSALGIGTAFVPLVGNEDIDERTGWLAFTSGLLGGAYVAERVWVRPYDHTQGDVAQIWLGTVAGGLMGGAVRILADANPTITLALVTGGGILGAIGGHYMTRPARARPRFGSQAPRGEPDSRVTVGFTPGGAVLAASGVRGTHGLLTIRF